MKAIVLDIDGTLVNDEKEITKKTKESLLKAQKQGIKIILASARPLNGMYRFSKELELEKYDGTLIAYNGAQVLMYNSRNQFPHVHIPLETSRNILNHLKKFDVVPIIDIDEYMYVNNVFETVLRDINIIEYESRGNGFLLCETNDLASLIKTGVPKILVAGEPRYLQANTGKLTNPFQGQVTMAFSAPFYLEYTALGIDKANTIKQVISEYGIDREEVYAFGDGENDITMLEYAGHSIAMGNATEKVLAIANEVTQTNNEDGIAYIINKMI